MKKIFTAMLCLAAIIIPGCGNSERDTGIEGIVDDFYKSDYEYQLTRKTTGENGDEIVVVYGGKVIDSPYEEYVKVVEPQEGTLWSECYYTKKGLGGRLVMRTNDEVTEQALVKREYPYGYGENLKFVADREETVDGVMCEVYKAEYTQTVGGGMRSKETLEAVISQEYYVDKEKKQLTMIYTDLEDLYRKNAIINYMIGDSSLTLETAQKRADAEDYAANETLKIFNYNGEIEMIVLEP